MKELAVVYGNGDEILAEQIRIMVEEANSRLLEAPVEEETDAWSLEDNSPEIKLTTYSSATWNNEIRGGDRFKGYVLFLDGKAGKGVADTARMTSAGYGIKHGYSGKRAAIAADTNAVYWRPDYVNFLRDLMNGDTAVPLALQQEDIDAGIRGDMINSLCLDALSVKTKNGRREFITDHKRRQMLFYGLMKFWDASFDQFMGL